MRALIRIMHIRPLDPGLRTRLSRDRAPCLAPVAEELASAGRTYLVDPNPFRHHGNRVPVDDWNPCRWQQQSQLLPDTGLELGLDT